MGELQGRRSALRIEVLEAIYRRSFSRFLRVALAIVRERELAREVVQEAFARAIQRRLQFSGQSAPEAWVWAIVVNQAHDVARQRSHDPSDGNEQSSENGHTQQWPELRAAIAALPERQRLAVFLRHYADMDYEQIADVLQVKRGTVAATLHAAHTTLRKQVSEVLG
jgi:RNA polymerase sigma-70 factor, ECF subfamily